MELKSEEEILGKVEEEIITGLDNVDPFEFAKEILVSCLLNNLTFK